MGPPDSEHWLMTTNRGKVINPWDAKTIKEGNAFLANEMRLWRSWALPCHGVRIPPTVKYFFMKCPLIERPLCGEIRAWVINQNENVFTFRMALFPQPVEQVRGGISLQLNSEKESYFYINFDFNTNLKMKSSNFKKPMWLLQHFCYCLQSTDVYCHDCRRATWIYEMTDFCYFPSKSSLPPSLIENKLLDLLAL